MFEIEKTLLPGNDKMGKVVDKSTVLRFNLRYDNRNRVQVRLLSDRGGRLGNVALHLSNASKEEMMGEAVFVGLLFADRIVEEKTGKKVIVGTFNTFHTPSFPATFPPWAIYASVTNLVGKHTFSLNLVHEETAQVVLALNGDLDLEDSSIIAEIVPGVAPTFHRPGLYTLVFNVDGNHMGARSLYVRELRMEGNSDKGRNDVVA
jgi:hypothetical protein